MGVLSSRNSFSGGWFTLQDEPVPDGAGPTGGPIPQRRRGRGLVQLAEPQPVAASGPARSFARAQFTRSTALERLGARVSRVRPGVVAMRYGALAASAAALLLVVLLIAVWGAGSASDTGALRRDRAQIALLSGERAEAVGAAARAESALAAAQAELSQVRAVALAEKSASSVRGASESRHASDAGGGR